VQATASTRTRLTAGWCAVALAAALAVVPAVTTPALAALGALGALLVAGAAWRWAAMLGPGIAALGAESLFVLPRSVWPPWAVLTGAGLFLVAELAAWAREARPEVAEEAPVVRARLRALALFVPGLAAVAAVVLSFAAASPPGDLARLAVGVAAGVALLCLLTVLARRLR
jgi:hypothetical protein